MKDVIVVGSGIGGLCTAVRLLKKGFKVTILEKEGTVGGKVNIKENEQFKFDLTASILMTPHMYTEVFDYSGRDYRDYFKLINLEPIYNVNFYDGSRFYTYKDADKMKEELDNLEKRDDISEDNNELMDYKYCENKKSEISDKKYESNSRLFNEYLDFMKKTMKKYYIADTMLINKPMIDVKEMLSAETVKSISKIKPLKSSHKYISKLIDNEKFSDYLIFLTMYMGINPYEVSNIYTMIPAISHSYGIGYIKGGFYNYILALVKLIYEMGGKIETNTEVQQIIVKNDRVSAVKTDKIIYKSDIVVCNADYPYAVKNLFHKNVEAELRSERHMIKKEASCSIFMIYLGLSRKFDELSVHNIYISRNFRESIEKPFKGDIPDNPSIYIYYPSAVDDTLCTRGKSVMNLMVRVPNLSFKNIQWNEEKIHEFRKKIINEIKNIKGLENIEKYIEYEDYLIPDDLQGRFNSYEGSAFGLSHKLSQSLILRPAMKEKNLKGLYFIGSSTHPGNGVSIIIEGTKVLAEIIQNDYL